MSLHVRQDRMPSGMTACHGISTAKGAGGLAGLSKETAMKPRFATLAVLALLTAAPAFALEPLNTEKRFIDSLVAGRVADVIRNTCPSISAKMFTVLQELNALEDYLRDKGYSEAEVKAFRKNKDEKARIKGLANDYLTAAGAVEGDAESYCKVGRDEIAKESLAGSLLRSWK
jgi:Skp family chaperone for outer membrane proteins